MTFPFENRIKLILYLLLWILYALLHILSLAGLVFVPVGVLFIDAFIHALLYAVIGILLWSAIQFGNYQSLPIIQQVINYGALAILSISIWVGLGYLLDYIFLSRENSSLLVSTLPLKSVFGLFLYLILILSFRERRKQEEKKEEDAEDSETEDIHQEVSINESEQSEMEILERIAVKIGQKIHVIHVSDILYFQSYGDYVQIITEKEKYIKEQTMKYFESHLPQHQFARVHRSYIVNVEAISRIEAHVKQNQLIILKNGEQLKVSANGYKTLRTTLNL